MVRVLEGFFRTTTDRYPEIIPAVDHSIPTAAKPNTFERASVAYDTTGDSVVEQYAIDVLRTGVTTRTVSTNYVTNPRGEYTTQPSFPTTTLPDNWSGTTSGSGITREVVATGVDGFTGASHVDIRYYGTPSSTGAQTLIPQGGLGWSIGETVTNSVYIGVVGGSMNNVSNVVLRNVNEGTSTVAVPVGMSGLSSFARVNNVRTLSVATAAPTLRWNYIDTVSPVDITIRIGSWQLERVATLGPLALPPVGTKAISTATVPVNNGILLESSADNRVLDNLTTGFFNGGAQSSAASTDLAALYPGATIWKMTKGVSGDSNFSNMMGGTIPASSQVIVSAFVWFPLDTTATNAQLGQDSATSTGTGVNYDFARKGTWQRIWRSLVTQAAPNVGFQFRVSGMTDGHFCYATLECVELGTYPTSPIITTGATVTRSAENYNYEDAVFNSIFGAGAPKGWVIMDVLVASQGTTGAGRYFAQVDDGSNNNRIQFRINISGASIVTVPVLGGVSGSAISNAVAPVYGTIMRVGFYWNAGAHGCCVNGGAVSAGTGGIATGYITLRVGSPAGTGSELDGRIYNVWAGSAAATTAQLQAACVYGADVNSIIPLS